MTKPKILVTGATGKTGTAVVHQMLASDYPVRALVHKEDMRSEALRRAGAEIIAADMFDPDQLLDAIRGTQRAYYLPLFDPQMIHAATAFALAAREAKLEAIVQMGQWLAHRAHPALLTRQTWLIDRLFGLLPNTAHVIVNPGMFADNFLRVIDFAALLGVFPVFMGDSRSAPVSNEDMARTIAALLKAPERHHGMRYRPTGPALLSGKDMAAIIARVVGHGVMPVKMPFALFNRVAHLQGVDPFQILSLRDYIRDNKSGAFEFEGGVNDVVEELTGAPAESFETTARRYAALPFARQTTGNRLKAIGNFLITPLVPPYPLDRIARQMRIPVPPNPSLSIEDERWRHERSDQNARQARPSDRMIAEKSRPLFPAAANAS